VLDDDLKNAEKVLKSKQICFSKHKLVTTSNDNYILAAHLCEFPKKMNDIGK